MTFPYFKIYKNKNGHDCFVLEIQKWDAFTDCVHYEVILSIPFLNKNDHPRLKTLLFVLSNLLEANRHDEIDLVLDQIGKELFEDPELNKIDLPKELLKGHSFQLESMINIIDDIDDHKKWMKYLEASVKERYPFSIINADSDNFIFRNLIYALEHFGFLYTENFGIDNLCKILEIDELDKLLDHLRNDSKIQLIKDSLPGDDDDDEFFLAVENDGNIVAFVLMNAEMFNSRIAQL